MVFGGERGRDFRFAEHFAEIDFDGAAHGGDGDIVRAAFEGVFAAFADFVHGVKDPGNDGSGGDGEPDEIVAEFLELLDEAEGREDDEEPDEEVIEGGVLAGVGEVFDAFAAALGVDEGAELAVELEGAEGG